VALPCAVERGVVADDVVVRGREEAAGAARRVGDGLAGSRGDAVDDGADERARGEILPRAALRVLRVLLQ
jgi:hypothetical protein